MLMCFNSLGHEVLPNLTLPVLYTVSTEHWLKCEAGGAKEQEFISDIRVWEVVPAAKVKLTMLWRDG